MLQHPSFYFSSFTHQWISLNLNIIFSFAISLGQYGNKTIALTFLCNKLHFNRQRYFAQNIICLSKAIMGNFSFILSIKNWFRFARKKTFLALTFFAKRIILLKLLLKPDTQYSASIAKTRYMIITTRDNDSINTFLPIIKIWKVCCDIIATPNLFNILWLWIAFIPIKYYHE